MRIRLVPIRQIEGVSRIIKENPKNHRFFSVSFSILFLHEKKEYAPGGRVPL